MTAPRFAVLDRALYALFSAHADDVRHDADRKRYRGTTLETGFDVYLARVYGLSWLALLGVGAGTLVVLTVLVPDAAASLVGRLAASVPPFDRLGAPAVPWRYAAAGIALAAGLAAKRGTIALGSAYLRWTARARRAAIERTLPGAVRYLRALAAGSEGERTMLRKVATQDAYGETAVAFRSVLNKTALGGSFDAAVRVVARDTPSQDALAPFLLKFREYAHQGNDALEDYLRLEGQMLDRRQRRQRQQAEGFLELVAELFVVLLVLPTLLLIVLTVLSVLAPGLDRTLPTPAGPVELRVVIVYGCAGFVLAIGAASAWLVQSIRPPNVAAAYRDRADAPGDLLRTALRNPANAGVAFAPVALVVAVGLLDLGYRPVDAGLLAYVAYGLPVGGVSVRRARLDDAKDREIKDFVHAVAGHVSLGRPLPDAVASVAREVDLGALDGDVANLAFNLRVTARGDDVRQAALAQFVDDVGTPLAEQTIGLVSGALDVGSDPETVFDTLQAEIGRLYHEKKSLRANLLVYVAVGWTTAILVVGITIAINRHVLASFEQFAVVSESMGSYVLDPSAIDPTRDRYRFYVVTQATMLSCGWFAGYASRGRYEALLHSAALVAFAYVTFTATGAV